MLNATNVLDIELTKTTQTTDVTRGYVISVHIRAHGIFGGAYYVVCFVL